MGEKILVMQLARMGDLVQTWPLLRRLQHIAPKARVELLCDSRWRELAPEGPQVAEVLGLDLPGLAASGERDFNATYKALQHKITELRVRQYDCVLALNFSRVALLLAHLLGVPVWGYRPVQGGREFGRDPWLAYVFALVHVRRLNRLHVSDVFRHLAPDPLVEPPSPAPRPPRRQPVIVLQPGTRHPRRTWPLDSFTRLAELLLDGPAARLWITGTTAERHLGKQIIRGLPVSFREKAENLQGRTDLVELAQCLKEADLVISGDTGTLHLAAALGTPILGIYLGPARCFETGPYGSGHLVLQTEPDCHPCPEGATDCPPPGCQALISPELAARVAQVMLTGAEVSPFEELPQQIRLYQSEWDALGSHYRPVGRPCTLMEVMGEAYRRTGARLLGYPEPVWPAVEIAPEAVDQVETMVEFLTRQSPDETAPSPLMAALKPLRVFHSELLRQSGGGHGERGQASGELVRQALAQHLVRLIQTRVERPREGREAGRPINRGAAPPDQAAGTSPSMAGW